MRAIVVVSVELPEPEDVVEVIRSIDPPNLPHFAGQVRIAVGENALAVESWLDGDDLSTIMRWPEGGPLERPKEGT